MLDPVFVQSTSTLTWKTSMRTEAGTITLGELSFIESIVCVFSDDNPRLFNWWKAFAGQRRQFISCWLLKKSPRSRRALAGNLKIWVHIGALWSPGLKLSEVFENLLFRMFMIRKSAEERRRDSWNDLLSLWKRICLFSQRALAYWAWMDLSQVTFLSAWSNAPEAESLRLRHDVRLDSSNRAVQARCFSGEGGGKR